MRHPVLLIFINAMILIVVFCLMTQSLVVIQRLAQAEKISGRVEVQRGGKGNWQALWQNDMIKTGDIVRSQAASTAEFKWADGTRWKIMPETQITVEKSTHNTVQRADQSQLKLSSGKVFIRIVKALSPASRFEVETPTAVAAVRGTIFSVEYQNGQSEVAVFKGRVAVKSAGEETLIEPGKAAISKAPGDLSQASDAAADAQFQTEKTIVLPELSAQLETLPEGKIFVTGQTETGDALSINGQNARVLGNGAFRFRMKNNWKKASPRGDITIIATDKHGARATRVLNAAAPRAVSPVSPVSPVAPVAPVASQAASTPAAP